MATQVHLDKQAQITEDLATIYPSMAEERIERLAQAIERAENYPIFGDGTTRPVAISNITFYTASNGQERVVINLAAKTLKCYGQERMGERNMPMPNANISQPADWKLKFQKGDYVCMFIQDGEVKKLYPASAMQATQITVNSKAVAQVEKAMHGTEALDVDTETGEVQEDKKAAKGTPKKAVVEAGVDDDLPF